MIFGRPNIARVMQLLDDGARLRVVARILHFPPRVVGRLWRSYGILEIGARSYPGDKHTAKPFSHLLSRRNHMSTAKALEIDFCRATEIHFPDQIVRNKLHYDGMRARRPAHGPVLTAQHRAVRFNFARQH